MNIEERVKCRDQGTTHTTPCQKIKKIFNFKKNQTQNKQQTNNHLHETIATKHRNKNTHSY